MFTESGALPAWARRARHAAGVDAAGAVAGGTEFTFTDDDDRLVDILVQEAGEQSLPALLAGFAFAAASEVGDAKAAAAARVEFWDCSDPDFHEQFLRGAALWHVLSRAKGG